MRGVSKAVHKPNLTFANLKLCNSERNGASGDFCVDLDNQSLSCQLCFSGELGRDFRCIKYSFETMYNQSTGACLKDAHFPIISPPPQEFLIYSILI